MSFLDGIEPEIVDKIFQVEVDIPGKGSFGANVRPMFDIDSDNLIENLTEQASNIAWWGLVRAWARQEADLADRQKASRRGEVWRRIQDVAKSSEPPTKLTGKDLEALVESDSEVIKIEAESILRWRMYNQVAAVVRAMEFRHESLRSLASMRKIEIQQSQ